MNNDLTIALIAGLGSMLGWGLADFFAKKTIDQIGDVVTLFWGQFIGFVAILVIFLINPTVPTLQQFDPLFLLALGAVSALSYIPLYAGFGKGQVSLLSPTFASYAGLTALLSAWIFGEAIPELRQVAILIIFAGILAISADPRDIRRVLKKGTHSVKGLPEVLSAMVVYSFWLVFLDHFINGKDWVFYLLIIRGFASLTLLIFAFVRHISLRIGNRKLWKYVIAIGLFDVAAYSFVTYGFSASTLTSVIAVLSGTFSLPTMVLAWIFLKERITPIQTLAALTILFGVALIALS